MKKIVIKFLSKFLLSSLFVVTHYKIFAVQKEIMSPEINNVFLNHVYTIIDEDTYEEIKNSNFLKSEFCHCQEKTHANTEKSMNWTGFYMTGENTYIEFFNSKDKKHLQEMKCGTIGIGFSVDQVKEIEQITKILKQKFANNVNHELFKKTIDEFLIPWFYYTTLTNNSSMMPQVDAWIMAYHKDYFKTQNIELFDENSISRQEYNKKRNAVPFDKSKLFKDIEEITLSLNDETKVKFIEQQTALGYICQEAKDCTICRGPGITFKLEQSKNQTCKILKLQMHLNHKVNNFQVYKLGNSTIELENETALWTFK